MVVVIVVVVVVVVAVGIVNDNVSLVAVIGVRAMLVDFILFSSRKKSGRFGYFVFSISI